MLTSKQAKLIHLVCVNLIRLHGIKSFHTQLFNNVSLDGGPDNPDRFYIALSSDYYGLDSYEEAKEEFADMYGDDFPFDGVSFEYNDQYVILSFDEAEKEILKVIDELGFSDKLERDCIFPKNGDEPVNKPV